MPRQPVALIADDEPTLRLLLAEALRVGGFTVTGVGDGPAALEAFTRLRPDAVVLDAMMPGMDGFEVCRRIRALPGGAVLPIVVISGMSVAELRPAALAAGATDVLGKPIQFLALGERLKALIGPLPDTPPGS